MIGAKGISLMVTNRGWASTLSADRMRPWRSADDSTPFESPNSFIEHGADQARW